MSQEQQRGFKDLTDLTKWVKWSLYAQVAITIIAIISSMLEYQLLSDIQKEIYTSEEIVVAALEASDTRQSIVGIIQLMIFVVSGILILKWIYRANFNAHQLGASEMKFSPGWSIGWYFIPIASLWKPYQAMKEIWQVSANAKDWKTQPVPSLLRWWWFFWIAPNVLGFAAIKLAIQAQEISEFIVVNVITQLSNATWIPLSLIVIALVSRINDMQMTQVNAEKTI